MALDGIVINTKEFDDTLKQYLKLTSKTVAEAANSMAYFSARNAVISTIHADRKKMESSLGRYVNVTGKNKKGVLKTRKQFSFAKRTNNGTVLAFLIINSRRVKNGLAPLKGQKLRTAAKKMIMARIKSINFVRAGWIPAVKRLAKFIRISRVGKGFNSDSVYQKIESDVKVVGMPKGDAKPAYPQNSVFTGRAIIANSVGGSGGITSKFVQNEKIRGLKLAIVAEMKSKIEYIERKFKEDAKMVTVKTIGSYATK